MWYNYKRLAELLKAGSIIEYGMQPSMLMILIAAHFACEKVHGALGGTEILSNI